MLKNLWEKKLRNIYCNNKYFNFYNFGLFSEYR